MLITGRLAHFYDFCDLFRHLDFICQLVGGGQLFFDDIRRKENLVQLQYLVISGLIARRQLTFRLLEQRSVSRTPRLTPDRLFVFLPEAFPPRGEDIL